MLAHTACKNIKSIAAIPEILCRLTDDERLIVPIIKVDELSNINPNQKNTRCFALREP
jgi:hypothetical protein